jgi:hypothetical protein
MKGSAPAPALHLFQFESDKFQPPPIDEIERAIRLSAHDQAGNGIDHKPKTVLDRLRPWDSFILTKRLHKNAPENCIVVVRQLAKPHVYVPLQLRRLQRVVPMPESEPAFDVARVKTYDLSVGR